MSSLAAGSAECAVALTVASAEVFRERVLATLGRTPAPVHWVIIAADAISLIG